MIPAVVYTDLDGSLLDHHSYSFEPARTMLTHLAVRGIPLIPCTSKTRSELMALRTSLANTHPFIVENGAAVFLPAERFARAPETCVYRDGFWVYEAVPRRAQWQPMLAHLRNVLGNCFTPFSAMTTAEIAACTGLNETQAFAAGQRDYGEAILWRGNDEQRSLFEAAVRAEGGVVHEGGRFLHVMGPADKGAALRWLHQLYADCAGTVGPSIALGDGRNDVPMLEAADYAVLIRSPVHAPPELMRPGGVVISDLEGPAGWAQGLALILNLITDTDIKTDTRIKTNARMGTHTDSGADTNTEA
jgi:mannosyl-3-phosphoglycerate phosphatase family protein